MHWAITFNFSNVMAMGQSSFIVVWMALPKKHKHYHQQCSVMFMLIYILDDCGLLGESKSKLQSNLPQVN